MLRSVRGAVCQVRRHPAFAIVAIAIIAIGIGATSAVLSVVNAVLLAPLPFPEPDRIVVLGGQMTRDGTESEWPISPLDIEDVSTLAKAFSSVAVVSNVRSFNLVADGEIEHVSGELVGADLFRIYGLTAVAGRVFTADEARAPGAAQVAVISHDLWRRRYGADPNAVGTSVTLNDVTYQLIGVLPPGFHGSSDEADVWLPMGVAGTIYNQPAYLEMREFRWAHGVARLQAGVTRERAAELLRVHSRAMEERFPKDNRGFRLDLTGLVETARGSLRGPLLALLAAAAFVLLIVCTNVANLLLAKGAGRVKELAVRRALGAESGALIGQLLIESAVLGVLGALLGLPLAAGLVKVLVRYGSLDLASFQTVTLDWRVILVALLVVVVATLGFGLAPAIMATRGSVAELTRGNSRGATAGAGRGRFQSVLIACEVGVALVLLVGAGLTTKGFQQFINRDLGYRPDGLLSLRLDFSLPRFGQNEPYALALDQLVSRVGAVPGVRGAALEGPGFPTSGPYLIALAPTDGSIDAGQIPQARRHNVSPGYFTTLGIPLLQGRDIDRRDAAGAERVAVISRRIAGKLWPGQDPLGRQLIPNGNRTLTLTVVGVVGDVLHNGPDLDEDTFGDAYFPAAQFPPRNPALVALLIRGDDDVASLTGAITAAIRDVAPGVAPYQVDTIRGHLNRRSGEGRFLMFLMTAFAVIALGLAAIGIYGVVASIVEQQTREIGVRMALGADRSTVRRLVLRRALGPTVVGGIGGIVVAAALSRAARSLLYGLSPFDPITFAIVLGILGAVALIATLVPARRATAIDPLIALRSE